jgi:hypothetical protein
VVVDGGAFLRVIRAMVSDIDLGLASKVPATIYAALGGMTGRVGMIATLLSDDTGLCIGYEPKCGVPHPFVQGAYYSIICHDEVPFIDPVELDQAAGDDAGYREAYVDGPYLKDICPAWKVGSAEGQESAPLTSSIPTLIYVGAYDSFGSSQVTKEAASTCHSRSSCRYPSWVTTRCPHPNAMSRSGTLGSRPRRQLPTRPALRRSQR